MSVPQTVAGAMLGGVAEAVVAALESLGRERDRQINGGFLDEVMMLTSMTASDVNPVVIRLLELGVLARRGEALLEVCPLTKPLAHQLSGGLLF